MRAGEEAGRLDEALRLLSVVYRAQAMATVKRLLHVSTLGVFILILAMLWVTAIASVKVALLLSNMR